MWRHSVWTKIFGVLYTLIGLEQIKLKRIQNFTVLPNRLWIHFMAPLAKGWRWKSLSCRPMQCNKCWTDHLKYYQFSCDRWRYVIHWIFSNNSVSRHRSQYECHLCTIFHYIRHTEVVIHYTQVKFTCPLSWHQVCHLFVFPMKIHSSYWEIFWWFHRWMNYLRVVLSYEYFA